MCGIVGIMARQELSRKQYELFIKAWIKASERGTDAAGAIMSAVDGVQYWKSPGDINKIVSDFRMSYPYRPGIRFLLGHTRMATGGSPLDNMNNHPIVTRGKTLLGIHNGVIWNKDELFRKEGIKEAREVDTEAAYRLIAHYGPDNIKPLEVLEGSFNLAYCHTSTPNRFYLVRKDNPLEILTGHGFFAFASMSRYWEGLDYRRKWDMSNNTVYRVNRKSWDIRKFEPKKSYSNWTYSNYGKDTWGRDTIDKKDTTVWDDADYGGGYYLDPETHTLERQRPKKIWPHGEPGI